MPGFNYVTRGGLLFKNSVQNIFFCYRFRMACGNNRFSERYIYLLLLLRSGFPM